VAVALVACGDDRIPAPPPSGDDYPNDSGERDVIEAGAPLDQPICMTAESYPGAAGLEDCSLHLEESVNGLPPDYNKVNVTVSFSGETTVLGQVIDANACEDARAWYYDDREAPSRVELCEAACAFAASDPDAIVAIVFGCDTSCFDDDAGCFLPPD
jgi:hypothetical protein